MGKPRKTIDHSVTVLQDFEYEDAILVQSGYSDSEIRIRKDMIPVLKEMLSTWDEGDL